MSTGSPSARWPAASARTVRIAPRGAAGTDKADAEAARTTQASFIGRVGPARRRRSRADAFRTELDEAAPLGRRASGGLEDLSHPQSGGGVGQGGLPVP